MDVSLIQAKLTKGLLPSEWDTAPRTILGGLATCAACDEPTTPHDVAVECQHAGRRFVLHPDCYVMWEEARSR